METRAFNRTLVRSRVHRTFFSEAGEEYTQQRVCRQWNPGLNWL